ncbi:MAG TPA: LuxR C-terminal-related transcriptional regulator [Bryobacteraceae bacterium]|nr:LuxR C-terminal-related transcriptional regulator [Bryobacteraceae bacterium]
MTTVPFGRCAQGLLFRKFTPPEKASYNLTPHENRLLRLPADGHSYRSAATKLGLSVNTVAFHMKRVYEKLHVHSKTQAVAKAIRQGLAQ